MATRYRTARQIAAQRSAEIAVRRALAHTTRSTTTPAQDDDEVLGRAFPFVTTTRAREIRAEIEADRSLTAAGGQHPQEHP